MVITVASTAVLMTPGGEIDSNDDSMDNKLATKNMPQAPLEEPMFGGQGTYDGRRILKRARHGDKPTCGGG